jgi:hypothetical protein
MNPFITKGLDELELIFNRLTERIVSGSTTSLSIGPGLRDEFAEKSEQELRQLQRECYERMSQLDPKTYPPADAKKRMKIVTSYQ